jgi:hypothetical protein
MLALLFLFAHWITERDAYRVHRQYVNPYGNVMGGYYQPRSPRYQPTPKAEPYTAYCYEFAPVEVATEAQAVEYVEHCPLW